MVKGELDRVHHRKPIGGKLSIVERPAPLILALYPLNLRPAVSLALGCEVAALTLAAHPGVYHDHGLPFFMTALILGHSLLFTAEILALIWH
jgi:hypothetical protein